MSELSGDTAGDDGNRQEPSGVAAKHQSRGGDNRFADDVHSITIQARQRTFYIDLKESGNGKFFKVSEKSRGGRKTTIMFDSEDLDAFINAFQEMKSHVS